MVDDKKDNIGRPTDLNLSTQKKICEAISRGATQRDAAMSAGIGRSTFLEWIRRGNDTDSTRSFDPIYADFADAVEKAEAECAVRMAHIVCDAAPENWQAGMTWLERRRPDDWARRDKVQHGSDPENPVIVRTESDIAEVLADIPTRAGRVDVLRKLANIGTGGNGDGSGR